MHTVRTPAPAPDLTPGGIRRLLGELSTMTGTGYGVPELVKDARRLGVPLRRASMRSHMRDRGSTPNGLAEAVYRVRLYIALTGARP